MFIRRKPNKRGSFSVLVLDKRSGRNVLLRSFGLSKDEAELRAMEQSAMDFIAGYGGQGGTGFRLWSAAVAGKRSQYVLQPHYWCQTGCATYHSVQVIWQHRIRCDKGQYTTFINHSEDLRAQEQDGDSRVSILRQIARICCARQFFPRTARPTSRR